MPDDQYATQADAIRAAIAAEEAEAADTQEAGEAETPLSTGDALVQALVLDRQHRHEAAVARDEATRAADAEMGFGDDATLARYLDLPHAQREQMFRDEARRLAGSPDDSDFLWRLRRAVAGPEAARAMDAAVPDMPETPALVSLWGRSPRAAAMVASLFGKDAEGQPYVKTMDEVRAAEEKEERLRDDEGRFMSRVFHSAHSSPAQREIQSLRAELAELKAQRRAERSSSELADDNRASPAPRGSGSVLSQAERMGLIRGGH